MNHLYKSNIFKITPPYNLKFILTNHSYDPSIIAEIYYTPINDFTTCYHWPDRII